MSMHDIFVCAQKEKKKKRKSKKNQNTFTWLQACFLGDVRVIWCNSLGDSYFQSNVIDNAENFLEYYLHITYSVFCTLTSSTHYRQIFAKSSTWDCVRCLIRPSLIAYDLMCKYNIYIFKILVENLKNNVFRSSNLCFQLLDWFWYLHLRGIMFLKLF